MLLLLLTPAPVLAGGGIQVVGQHAESNFPANVTFSVTARSEQDIVRVRLNLRSAGSGAWTYAHPQFNPGREVTATHALATTGASYLPPGAEIEYQYVIEDATGNRLETPPDVYEFDDTRFQWREVQVGPLALRYYDLGDAGVARQALELEDELRRVTDLLQSEPSRPIRGFVYNNRFEAEDALPQYSRTMTEQQVFHGFAFANHRVFLAVGFQEGVIVHESTHLLLDQTLGPRSARIPSWLDEGLASYMEPGARPYSGRSLSPYAPPLRAMSSVSGTPQEIHIFYRKAESVVAYLIEAEGTESFQRFLKEVAAGRTIDQALVDAYGFDTDGLDHRWSTSNLGTWSPSPGSRTPAGPLLIMLLNNWLLGGLVLVVATIVLARLVINKLRPPEDPEEGLQPWEDPDLQ